jgi:signal transduction histidine kinase
VTAFGKVLRTTAFRLALVYLFFFSLFAASLLGYFAWNTQRLINEQITSTVNAEVSELYEEFERGGIRKLLLEVEARSLRPGANLYLVSATTGQELAGNVGEIPAGTMNRLGWSEISYQRLEGQGRQDYRALVRVFELPSGMRMLVGRDLEERQRLLRIVASGGRWSIFAVIALGILGGIFVARRVLRRIDAMTGTTQRIMAGNLSERLVVGRSGDEIDRLAENLNAMLDRIETLMRGMKEVSDNIAHDLKTPLTRLRNRAEQALGATGDIKQHREALERTIEESDGLIRTFNALLMIARAESGQARDGMAEFDAAEVARGIQELYEPLAEDRGLTLAVSVGDEAKLYGNRELVSQALANLVENAIKYGRPASADTSPDIVVEATRFGNEVLLGVSDHGPGIPEADRKRAVERFVRLEPSRTEPGSGLGLSLASAVATLHGGMLELSDNAPGLRVVLRLPDKGPEQKGR